MNEFLDRYFPVTREYPDPVELMMEPGVLLEYISITYLTGWINYVEIASAFLVTRYRRHQSNVADALVFNDPTAGRFHTNLATDLKDVVVILARAKHRPTEWWFFYCDRDVSDCEIGRFVTDDAPERVLGLFAAHAHGSSEEGPECGENEASSAPAIPLRPEAFTGWITL